jgi:ABC-type branched-subunit amino acid transport system permease subunit
MKTLRYAIRALLKTPGFTITAIVTLMLAQVAFLSALYFNNITMGEQGIVLSNLAPAIILGHAFPLADSAVKYNLALAAFALARPGVVLSSNTVNRTPSNRASPL